jgi:hypothetical protein
VPTLIALIVFISGSWYFFIATHAAGGSVPTRAVLASLGASGQLVLTVTISGAIGRLTPGTVGLANVVLSLLWLGMAARAAGTAGTLIAIVERDRAAAGAGVRAAVSWENVALAVLFVFACAWIATVIRFYPPRGIDDVTYHLPAIYQAIQDKRLVVLPLELRGHFAYPLNGEMLFVLVPLFTGTIRWIDGTQALVWIVGMGAVFSLGRRFSLTPRGAFLAAALFGAMPVSLLQTTTNYVDLISAAWILSAAVALWQYETSGSRLALALCGLGIGLFAGTKASTLPLSALSAAFATSVIWRRTAGKRGRPAAACLFVAALLATGAYWYVRDWIVIGNPLYPYPVRAFGRTIFTGTLEIGRNSWSAIFADPAELIRIGLWDPGLGSFHGGFGFLFWGFAAPAVALRAVRLIQHRATGSASQVLTLSLLPFGLATLLLVGHADLFVFARLVLIVGAPAFISFALLIDEIRTCLPGAATAMRSLATGAAVSALVLTAGARWPLMNLHEVAADSKEQRSLSEFRYLAQTNWDHRPLSAAWAPLDEMTRGGAGLTVYQAADWPVFWTASTYGTELQNHIWNFIQDRSPPPQAFLFHSRTGNPFYLGREISRETIAANPRFRLVAASGGDVTTLYVANAGLAEKERAAHLARYYRIASPMMVATTEKSLADLEVGAILLARFPFAAGYLVHEADGRLRAELRPIAAKDQDQVAAAWPDRVVYTTNEALAGRVGRIVAKLEEGGAAVPLFRHEAVAKKVVAR